MAAINRASAILLAQELHNPDYGKRVGHVFQVWEDGEITLQKSGPLLWQRTLHRVYPGNPSINVRMPVGLNNHSYAMVEDRDAAIKLREAILSSALDR